MVASLVVSEIRKAATKISLTPEQELVVALVGAGKVYPVVYYSWFLSL